MGIDPTLAATNPQAAYAMASVPVTAPQQQTAPIPVAQAGKGGDTVSFSGSAAYAQPQEEEKSAFNLRNIFGVAVAAIVGLAAFKTHGTLKAFKGLEAAANGSAVQKVAEGATEAAGDVAKKVSDTHELGFFSTFIDHLKHPIKLIKSVFSDADDKAIETIVKDNKFKPVEGDAAKGLLYTSEDETETYFRHNDGFFKLTKKEGAENAVKNAVADATNPTPGLANPAAANPPAVPTATPVASAAPVVEPPVAPPIAAPTPEVKAPHIEDYSDNIETRNHGPLNGLDNETEESMAAALKPKSQDAGIVAKYQELIKTPGFLRTAEQKVEIDHLERAMRKIPQIQAA